MQRPWGQNEQGESGQHIVNAGSNLHVKSEQYVRVMVSSDNKYLLNTYYVPKTVRHWGN